MKSANIKMATNIGIAIALWLFAVSFVMSVSHADISNPHPTPPVGSVTNAMLANNAVTNAKVSATAAIVPTKISDNSRPNTVPFSNGTVLDTDSSFKYSSSTKTLSIIGGTISATTTQFNGVSITFPSTQCGNNKTYLNDGAGNLSCGGSALHTFSKLTSTSTTLAIYTTPANATQLIIRMLGAGGGGEGATVTAVGTDGTASNFGTGSATTSANGGQGGQFCGNNSGRALGGVGGVTSVGTEKIRIGGASVGDGATGGSLFTNPNGANSIFGGAGSSANTAPGENARYLSGSGGGGGITGSQQCQGGAAGEYVEFFINTPAATYKYNVGKGGNGSAGSTQAGGQGGDGIILIEEVF